jgi:glycosyltransferase involved in cell wall biosynthesis
MKPLVSVKTITYNQAPYIRRCIEGVLMQKTTFPFELVIGEDCSTDGTREIVLDYAQKNPEIIRVITSESNVGAKENSKRTNFACKGEFIAYCEGDDYWIDPLKLQKQYEAGIKYDAVLVSHGTIFLIYQVGKLIRSEIGLTQDESGYLDIEDIILKNKNFETSSIFIRSNIIKNLPDWYEEAPIGDVPLKLISASLGKVYFISEIMSVYQKGLPNSWTDRKAKIKSMNDTTWRSNFEKAYLEMYKKFDDFSGYRYSKTIHQIIHRRLERHLRKYENLNILDISEGKKKTIRIIAYLSRFTSDGLRNAIRRKIVEKFTLSI